MYLTLFGLYRGKPEREDCRGEFKKKIIKEAGEIARGNHKEETAGKASRVPKVTYYFSWIVE